MLTNRTKAVFDLALTAPKTKSSNQRHPWARHFLSDKANVIVAMLERAESQRKKHQANALKKKLLTVVNRIELFGSYLKVCAPFALYWRGVLEIFRGNTSRARGLFIECVATSESSEGSGKYDGVLAQLKLIDLGGATPNSELLNKIGVCADLYMLASLGERGNNEAANLYGEILDEPLFSELFELDNVHSMIRSPSETESTTGGSEVELGYGSVSL